MLQFLEGYGVNSERVLYVLIGIAVIAFLMVNPFSSTKGFGIAIALAPLYLPPLLFVAFYHLWIEYVRYHFWLKQGSVLLEIRLPQEVTRSPAAFEMMLTNIYQTASADNLIQSYWDGKYPPTYSLELISIDGQIHFYIWSHPRWRGMIETQLYAQYPGIEITEAPDDYALKVQHDREKNEMIGFYFGLAKPPHEPIKRYMDYKLDQNPKPEEVIDPMSSTLEFLGSLKKGEQVWVQILLQPHRKEGFKEGELFHKKKFWTEAGQRAVDDIVQRDSGTLGPKQVPKEGDDPKLWGYAFPRFVGEMDWAKTILGYIYGKFPFECVIRGMYITEKGKFNPGNIGSLISMWRVYNSPGGQGITPRWRTDFDWPWQEGKNRENRNELERDFLDAYKRRSFFSGWYAGVRKVHPFILTAEAIATIYHIPSSAVQTPTLPRVPSVRADAPSNLPT